MFIEVFRYSYGSPTKNINPETGKEYQSGMEEEFYTAYAYWKEHQKPEVIILRSEEPIPRAHLTALKDYEKLVSFFSDFSGGKEHPGLYNTFDSEQTFREVFRRNVLSYIFRVFKKDINLSIDYNKWSTISDCGYSNLYLNQTNQERNQSKQEQIRETTMLRLRARSGYSFINKLGCFHADITEALEHGMKFRIILQNPFSVNAFYAAMSPEAFPSAAKYKEYKNRAIPFSELMDIYKSGHWYSDRFMVCLKNYSELKKAVGKNIELRLSDIDCSTSILISDKKLFWEPYLNSIRVGRRNLALFEIEALSTSNLYEEASRDFDLSWQFSLSFTEFGRKKKDLEERLIQYLRANYDK